MGSRRHNSLARSILRRSSTLAVMTACAALMPAPAFAQTPTPPSPSGPSITRTFSIRGSLRSASTNQGLEMIKIELKKFTGETVSVAFTRSNGEFEFAGLNSGEYVIEVDEEGYEPIRESIELRSTTRAGVFLYLREPITFGAGTSTAPSVPARELALSRRAGDALRRGREELFDKKNPGGSLKHFEKLIRDAPGFYEAHYYEGLAQFELGRLDLAEACFRKSIEGGSESQPRPFLGLASLLSQVGRFREAEQAARKAMELENDAWQGHYELARALLGLNRLDEAQQHVQVAQKKQPDYPDLYLIAANIHIRKQDPQQVLVALDEYLRLAPNGPSSESARQTRTALVDRMKRAGQQLPQQPPPK